MPTYNRQKYALRAIRFWAGTEVQLIVIDGTLEPISKDIVKDFPDNITYISDSSSWTNRMKLGAKKCLTEYSALISDDEFYLPSSLVELIHVLDDDKSLVSAIGHVLRFYPYKLNVYYQYSYPEFKFASIFYKDSILRVEKHLNPYRVISLYAVIRTDCFRKNIEVADICSRFPNSASFELGFEIANAYQGGMRVLPIVSWLRSNENAPLWNTKTISINDWWKKEKDSKEFLDAALSVQKIFSLEFDLDLIEKTRTVLYVGFEAYCQNQRKVTTSKLRMTALNLKKRIRSQISDDWTFGFKLKFAEFMNNGQAWIDARYIAEHLQAMNLSIEESEMQKVSTSVIKSL
jgi:glycosyltransferase domain-containing protein